MSLRGALDTPLSQWLGAASRQRVFRAFARCSRLSFGPALLSLTVDSQDSLARLYRRPGDTCQKFVALVLRPLGFSQNSHSYHNTLNMEHNCPFQLISMYLESRTKSKQRAARKVIVHFGPTGSLGQRQDGTLSRWRMRKPSKLRSVQREASAVIALFLYRRCRTWRKRACSPVEGGVLPPEPCASSTAEDGDRDMCSMVRRDRHGTKSNCCRRVQPDGGGTAVATEICKIPPSSEKLHTTSHPNNRL